ncbi:MAG: TAT-variant-translocated molybdopterin oxidoreductase, partial [Flavobacteriales bacterium]
MGIQKKYWSSLDELANTSSSQEALTNEFSSSSKPAENTVESFLADEKLAETNTGRRDFLKFMGFGIAAATLAACETPVVKSIPYVVKPEDITPGVANYYASTYYDGVDYGNLLVKTREGRPIHIKGNDQYGLSKGALNARMNASVLGLYDGARLKNPKKSGSDIDWTTFDADMKSAATDAKSIRILSSTIISPSTQKAIQLFSEKYAGKVKHIQYDVVSYSGLKKANGGIPQYNFSEARTIVSIGADFLGTWLTPALFVSQYKETRKPESGWMSKHYQFEANMSLTGSNSDVRTPIKPSQEGLVAAAIYAGVTGGTASDVDGATPAIQSAVKHLLENKGQSIVVAGSNNPNVQAIVAAINKALGNEGKSVDVKNKLNLFQGSDEEVSTLIQDMKSGSV